MRIIGLILMGACVLLTAACSTEESIADNTTYTLNAEETTLIWSANMGPNYGHTGTISVTEGTMKMNEDVLIEGSFTIDMNSLKNTDLIEAGEVDKAGYLVGHLTGTMVDENHPAELFFNVPVFPTTTVSLGEYKDGKLALTVSTLGKEISQEVPMVITHDEHGATIKGAFALDFTAIEIPGLQPNEDGSQINPLIDFNLSVVMTK
jgi:hypothetical protein